MRNLLGVLLALGGLRVSLRAGGGTFIEHTLPGYCRLTGWRLNQKGNLIVCLRVFEMDLVERFVLASAFHAPDLGSDFDQLEVLPCYRILVDDRQIALRLLSELFELQWVDIGPRSFPDLIIGCIGLNRGL